MGPSWAPPRGIVVVVVVVVVFVVVSSSFNPVAAGAAAASDDESDELDDIDAMLEQLPEVESDKPVDEMLREGLEAINIDTDSDSEGLLALPEGFDAKGVPQSGQQREERETERREGNRRQEEKGDRWERRGGGHQGGLFSFFRGHQSGGGQTTH